MSHSPCSECVNKIMLDFTRVGFISMIDMRRRRRQMFTVYSSYNFLFYKFKPGVEKNFIPRSPCFCFEIRFF
jgi:hypothetical protein